MFRITSLLPVVATLDPVAVVNTEQFTDVVDMSKYDQVSATLMCGNMAAETIDFKCYTCVAAGTSAVLLKSATQLAASATVNDGVQVQMSITAAEVGAAGKQFVKFGVVTGSTAGGIASIIVQAYDSRYGTASTNDLASVLEIS